MVINLPSNCNSVVVIASYRTGSTALCDIIAKQHNLINLDEAFHPAFPVARYNRNQTQSVVVKIMPDHWGHQDIDYLLEKSYIIGSARRDTVSQIASFYVCHVTQHWHDLSNSDPRSYTVPIDREQLENQVRYITEINYKYNQLVHKYSAQQFYYEDIKHSLSNSKFSVYVKPNNYNEICQAVESILKSDLQ